MTNNKNEADWLEHNRRVWNERADDWNQALNQFVKPEVEVRFRKIWLEPFLNNLPAPDKSVKILDAGCGNGQISLLLAKEGFSVYACDFSHTMLELATSSNNIENPVEFAQASVDKLPYPDGTFDGVHCRCVLDFMPSPARALQELHRVSRPGGILSVTIMGAASPIKKDHWLRFLDALAKAPGKQTSYLNGIAPWEAEKLLPVVGWKVLEQQGTYTPSAAGEPNQFKFTEVKDLPLLFQQTAATAWILVCRAEEAQPVS
jgi:ubiquinone/menaquinone biosynthesis C-methylase UbiE